MTIGVASWNAECSDTIAFDRPGPRETMQTPARLRSRPSATAMKPAPPSCRHTIIRIELRSVSTLVRPT